MISDSLDQKLTRRQRIALKMHMLMCKFCSRAERQIQFITRAVRHYLADVEALETVSDISLSPEACERIKRHLTETYKKEEAEKKHPTS